MAKNIRIPKGAVKQTYIQPPRHDQESDEILQQFARGSMNQKFRFEKGALTSADWIPSVSGWRLLPHGGIEFGSTTGVFPPGTITFADIQDISTARILGRTTASTGVIEQLTAAQVKTLLAIVASDISNFNEAAQDAVGGILTDSSTIDFTYDDAGNTITAILIAAFRRKSLFDHFADVGNVGTGEDDLYSDTLAAGQLANNGEKIEAQYGGIFVSSATATRQIRAYFGGTLIFDTGTLTLSLSSAWDLYVTVIRESSSVVRCVASLTTQGAALAAYTAYTRITGLTLSNTQVLKITGEAAAVGAATDDIVAKMGTVEWRAAA